MPAAKPFRRRILPALSLALLAAVGATVAVKAGGDKVTLPADLSKHVLYTTLDRPDLKQYRELYADPAAAAAARAGQPLPSGTVLTLVQFKAKLGTDGNPEKDSAGRFIKGELAGYAVMEKRDGWGAEYPEAIRNGTWEYQAFTPARAVNDKAKLENCFTCHKPLDKQDYVFSIDKLKAK